MPELKTEPRRIERVVFLATTEELERIDKYVEFKKDKKITKLGQRGEVLRNMILMTVGKWEKRNRDREGR
jgi:hypothetical protein